MTEAPHIKVFPSFRELVQATAEEMVGTINRAIAARGICFVALSGGDTPRPVYDLLGSASFRALVEWKYVHLCFGDERLVPPENPQSNFGMVNRELFSRIDVPAENIHRIVGEDNPVAAAKDYERLLKDLSAGGDLRFDLLLLGLGEDGHTASLFPGTEAVTALGSLVSAVFVPKLNSWRVTLTLECINNARKVMFLVAGGRKATTVGRIVGAAHPSPELPAALVNPRDGEVVWMIDADAASVLEEQMSTRSRQ
jgi:6-phosphogluconolactonase